jgi:HD-like signal output (HDOD) protein
MDKEAFLARLENVENLPTLPAVVRQLQVLIDNPRSNMAQIAAVITRDQAIATRIIRLTNSAFYGLSGRITSIQHAIVLLGLNTVKNLVTGVSVVKTFGKLPGAPLFDREKFWLHTFACALCARAIATDLKAEEPEDYFLAGLLHDMGILILDQFFQTEFIEILQRSTIDRIDYIDAEKAVLGLTHEEVGEFVAMKWKLPEVLMHSIRFHHKPTLAGSCCAGSAPLIFVVHLADTTVNRNGLHMGQPSGSKIFDNSALRTIRMTERHVEELFEGIGKEVKTVAAEWGV